MHLLKRTLQAACVALTFVVATTMMTGEASAQVGVHIGHGGGGVHWGGGNVHWGGHGGIVHGGGVHYPKWGGGIHQPHWGGGIHQPHWGGGHVWHNTTHVDYHPGQWVQHGGHFDWQQGHYDAHNTGHWDH